MARAKMSAASVSWSLMTCTHGATRASTLARRTDLGAGQSPVFLAPDCPARDRLRRPVTVDRSHGTWHLRRDGEGEQLGHVPGLHTRPPLDGDARGAEVDGVPYDVTAAHRGAELFNRRDCRLSQPDHDERVSRVVPEMQASFTSGAGRIGRILDRDGFPAASA